MLLDRAAAADLSGAGLVFRSGGGPVVLGNGDLDPSYEFGYRHGMLYHPDAWQHWEVSLFENNWEVGRTVTGNNNLNAILGTVDYMLADAIRVRYESNAFNVEVNRWGYTREAFSSMIGFRVFSLDKQFNMNAFDAGLASDYSIATDNDLYGVQVGGRYARSCDLFTAELLCKAGVYGNTARQDVLMRDINNTFVVRDFSNRDHSVAFLGEVEASLTWQLTHCLLARVGYRLIWLDGVARAPEQFQGNAASANARLNHGSDFLNGVTVGCEFSW